MPYSRTLCAAFLCLLGAGSAYCQTSTTPQNVFNKYKPTYFALPNGSGTLNTINNSDTVAGAYYPNTPTVCAEAYLRHRDGRVEIFAVPNAKFLTIIKLTDRGELLGDYQDATSGAETAFIRHAGGKIETFQLGGAAGSTHPTGLNFEGQVLGFLATSDTIPPDQPFLRYRDGQYLTFGVEGSDEIFTYNINDEGIALGSYFCPNSQGGVCGFYGKPGGTLTTFSFAPNGLIPSQINNGKVVTGVAYPTSGGVDGFIRTPDGKLTLFGLTTVDPLNVQINDLNEVITDYSAEVTTATYPVRYNYDIIRTADGKIGNYDPITSPGSLRGDAINDRGVIAGPGGPEGFFLLVPKK
jgi:hypothetical protein